MFPPISLCLLRAGVALSCLCGTAPSRLRPPRRLLGVARASGAPQRLLRWHWRRDIEAERRVWALWQSAIESNASGGGGGGAAVVGGVLSQVRNERCCAYGSWFTLNDSE